MTKLVHIGICAVLIQGSLIFLHLYLRGQSKQVRKLINFMNHLVFNDSKWKFLRIYFVFGRNNRRKGAYFMTQNDTWFELNEPRF